MNTRTKETLIDLIRELQQVAMRLPNQHSAELADSCKNAMEALMSDETIVEVS